MKAENFVQKCSYTTQISRFSCWVILLWLTLYNDFCYQRGELTGMAVINDDDDDDDFCTASVDHSLVYSRSAVDWYGIMAPSWTELISVLFGSGENNITN